MVVLLEINLTRVEFLNRHALLNRNANSLLIVSLDDQRLSSSEPISSHGHLDEKFKFKLPELKHSLTLELYKQQHPNNILLGKGSFKILHQMTNRNFDCWVDILHKDEPIAVLKFEVACTEESRSISRIDHPAEDLIEDPLETDMIYQENLPYLKPHENSLPRSRMNLHDRPLGPKPKEKRVSFNLVCDSLDIEDTARNEENLNLKDEEHMMSDNKDKIHDQKISSNLNHLHFESELGIPSFDDIIQEVKYSRRPTNGTLFGPRFDVPDTIVGSHGDSELAVDDENPALNGLADKRIVEVQHLKLIEDDILMKQRGERASLENPLKIE